MPGKRHFIAGERSYRVTAMYFRLDIGERWLIRDTFASASTILASLRSIFTSRLPRFRQQIKMPAGRRFRYFGIFSAFTGRLCVSATIADDID